MTERALRLQRLRRRVAVAVAATFAAAFGTVAANGSMGTDHASTADTAVTTNVDDSSGFTTTTTANVPSAATTRQS
ncbi:MAG: hypothetical protein QOI80_1262 [Solirubrobacteraceae bacterium]|jgi:hypothetical protein|nr:hypothetical protein [Solirubrobacteraceae bacterium]